MKVCDQKLASDSSGLPGGFSGQRAWVRILKKWAPGSYCLELVVAVVLTISDATTKNKRTGSVRGICYYLL
jgi:hypothetical protein